MVRAFKSEKSSLCFTHNFFLTYGYSTMPPVITMDGEGGWDWG